MMHSFQSTKDCTEARKLLVSNAACTCCDHGLPMFTVKVSRALPLADVSLLPLCDRETRLELYADETMAVEHTLFWQHSSKNAANPLCFAADSRTQIL